MAIARRLVSALVLGLAVGRGQAQAPPQPHIGYVFPAGGCRGTTVEILLGGQQLRAPQAVHVSGEGVEARIVQFYRPRRNLLPEQREALREKLEELMEKRWSELPGAKDGEPPWRRLAKRRKTAPKDAEAAPAELPEHPMLRNLESKSLNELVHIVDELISGKSFAKRQINTQLADMVLVEIELAPGAPPGDRQLRLETAAGLSNPMCFQVGALPEITETEPNDPGRPLRLPALPLATLPVVANGQILPGDVDRIPFRAEQGQRLVVRVAARHLVPYLADAVPGWFQATVALRGPRGEEVAFADDYQFDPDPVLFYDVPKSGVYELEIRDSIYRGREDFVYRASIGELPFVTAVFPLGGRTGEKVVAAVDGEHLPARRVEFDTRPGDWSVRRTAVGQGKERSNDFLYAVDELPESMEKEPNDNPASAQRVFLPRTLNGRIGAPGDVDVYCFRGQRNQRVVAEAMARRLRSPLDSLLRLTDAKGETVAWNDDLVTQGPEFLYTGEGTLTHHADSYLRATLPKDGNYYLHVADASALGGPAFAYRVRVSEPQPDFALRVSPSSLGLAGGRVTPLVVHVLRRDGFAGPVALRLRDAPPGMRLDGGRIPAGADQIRVTLTTPARVEASPVELRIEGAARVGGREIVRLARPVDDVMQAFLYRHLLPAEDMQATVRNTKWGAPRMAVEGGVPVALRAEGTTEVKLRTPPRTWVQNVEVVLDSPPKGIAVGKTRTDRDGYAFEIVVDPATVEKGCAGNLIAQWFAEVKPKPAPAKDKKGEETVAAKPRRISLGFLPAIPYEVVAR